MNQATSFATKTCWKWIDEIDLPLLCCCAISLGQAFAVEAPAFDGGLAAVRQEMKARASPSIVLGNWAIDRREQIRSSDGLKGLCVWKTIVLMIFERTTNGC